MFGASIGRGASRIIGAMVRGLARRRINPNVLTVIGVSINVLSGLLFGLGHFFWAGVILIVANLFDMLDGQVARRTRPGDALRRLPRLHASTASRTWPPSSA